MQDQVELLHLIRLPGNEYFRQKKGMKHLLMFTDVKITAFSIQYITNSVFHSNKNVILMREYYSEGECKNVEMV